MALSEFEIKKIENVMEGYVNKHRPPAHIRHELDLSYRINGQSIEIFNIRPLWNDKSKTIEEPIAKTTYVKTQRIWKIYWQRADLKWHGYEPHPEAETLEEFLSVVEKDEYCCFHG